MSQSQLNPVAQKTLASVLVSNEISKRAQAVLREKRARDEKLSTLIPEVVAALEKNERIYGHQKEAVAKALQDPAAGLELLRDVACHRNAGEVEAIGSGVGNVKSASAKSNPYTGQKVADFDETDAGRAFRDRILGSS